MSHKGFSHIGLSTLHLDKTRAFYEGVLGFKPVVADTIKIKEGGHLRHIFFDVGRDQLIAFLEPRARCPRRLLSFCFRGRFSATSCAPGG